MRRSSSQTKTTNSTIEAANTPLRTVEDSRVPAGPRPPAARVREGDRALARATWSGVRSGPHVQGTTTTTAATAYVIALRRKRGRSRSNHASSTARPTRPKVIFVLTASPVRAPAASGLRPQDQGTERQRRRDDVEVGADAPRWRTRAGSRSTGCRPAPGRRRAQQHPPHGQPRQHGEHLPDPRSAHAPPPRTRLSRCSTVANGP